MIINILYRIPWMLIAFFSFLLFYVCIFYWSFQPDVNFLLVKGNLVNHPVWRTVFYFHVLAGMLVISTGPMQFLGFIRKGYSKIHKTLGKIYISAILFIGAPTGLYMAFFAEGGVISTLGFIVMSILWFITTAKAFQSIRKKDFKAHSEWMIRSYAMSFSAVTLRLFVPLMSQGFGWEPKFVVVLTSWVSWLFNLAIAEILIRSNSKLLKL